MQEQIGVVIMGGDFQALGVMRTLARKDIPVFMLDSDHSISKYSRFKKRFIKSPPLADKESYLRFVIELAKKEGIQGWVILPNSDEGVYVLSKYKDVLEGYYRVPTPHWEVTQNLYIKEKTYQIAEKHGIPVPSTYYPKSLEEAVEMDIPYPVIIKPSIRDHFYKHVKIKAFLIHNQNELIQTYKKVTSIIEPEEVLVQEFIPGGPKNLYSFCPFFKKGKVVIGITARRSRQHPMDFGHATTFAELVDIPEIRKIAEKLLRLIDYYGIAEVEFMKDPLNGEYKLIEVNPRVWGWHTLAIAAGADLPYLLYLDMIGENIEVQPPLKDLKWIRLATDIPTVISGIVKGKIKVMDYLSSIKGKKECAVFSLSDPLPFVAEIVMSPYLWMKSGF